MFDKTATGASALKRSSGFTMVELLVTIAVASTLMAIAVPSFNQLIASSRLTTQANEIVTAISLARSEAIKRNGSLSFCRAEAETDTTCAGAAGNWEHWIVRTGAGTVVRRGVVNTFGGSVVVQSTLSLDQAVFGSDGLVRTGGALVDDHEITVCTTRISNTNLRRIVMGAGSRLSTTSDSEECES